MADGVGEGFKYRSIRTAYLIILILVIIVLCYTTCNIVRGKHVKVFNNEWNLPPVPDTVTRECACDISPHQVDSILIAHPPTTSKSSKSVPLPKNSVSQKNETGDNQSAVNNGSAKNIFSGTAKDNAHVEVGDKTYYKGEFSPDTLAYILRKVNEVSRKAGDAKSVQLVTYPYSDQNIVAQITKLLSDNGYLVNPAMGIAEGLVQNIYLSYDRSSEAIEIVIGQINNPAPPAGQRPLPGQQNRP